ncbi:MAG TPA: SCO family protein [Burkholderiales bacterium]|nr:SCO family protein [Burkholderiales bacterium]
MLRTALASACFAVLAYAAACASTYDFQVWTAEGARRLEVALHPVGAPAVAMSTVAGTSEPLGRLLKDEHAATIVDFIYTRCATVCLSLGSTFQQLQAAILAAYPDENSPPVRLLSISFDPAHDTPHALKQYAAGLGADPRVWRFAGVDDARHLPQLLQPYQVVVVPDEFGGFEHNAALLVVDSAGRLVRIFDYAEADTALAYARSLARGTRAR